jgi:hypothetical protein
VRSRTGHEFLAKIAGELLRYVHVEHTGLLRDDIDKEFLLLFLRSEAGLKQMERRMTGGLYPAIVQDELEKIRVPFRPHGQQVKTVESYKVERARIRRELEEAMRCAEKETTKIDRLLLAVSKL